jgi:hypothetical protein
LLLTGKYTVDKICIAALIASKHPIIKNGFIIVYDGIALERGIVLLSKPNIDTGIIYTNDINIYIPFAYILRNVG